LNASLFELVALSPSTARGTRNTSNYVRGGGQEYFPGKETRWSFSVSFSQGEGGEPSQYVSNSSQGQSQPKAAHDQNRGIAVHP